MRVAFFIVVLLHALIHILGFVKGFGLKEVKELSLPISKPMAVLWLTAALFLVAYSISHFTNHKYSWLIGFVAVFLSQALIIIFWKDAKFGTIPNVLILLVSLMSLGQFRFQKLVQEETANLLSPITVSDERLISESDISELPEAVKKWMRQSGALGKPYIHVGKILQQAEMKLKPEQEKWFEATAVQYSTIDEPAFIWKVDVQMNSLVNFQGRDKFQDGKGEMLIKLNSLLSIVDEKGEKLNEGALQRYLGEMVWFPSLALSPYITWQAVNDTTAIATMSYKGTKGSGTFYFNQQGDFTKFSAMRFRGNEPSSERQEWVLRVEDYKTFEGTKIPSKMNATWKLEDGDWTWLNLKIVDMKYNERALPSQE